MEFLVELADFVEADPIGDRIKALLLELARILDLPWHEETDVLAKRRPLQLPVVLLTRRLPAVQPVPAHPIYVLAEFLKMADVLDREDLTVISAVTIPFELMITADHPRFRAVSNAVVKPLIQLKGEIPIDPVLSFDQLKSPPAEKLPRGGDTCLLVLDVQPKFINHLPIDSQGFIARVCKALEIARAREWKIVITEQAPEKMGVTEPRVVAAAGAVTAQAKNAFSAYSQIKGYKHVVIVGLETQICVVLTVQQLLKAGTRVTVVSDGVASGCPGSDWSVFTRFRGVSDFSLLRLEELDNYCA